MNERTAITAYDRLHNVLNQDRVAVYVAKHPRAAKSRSPHRLERMDTNMRRTAQGWPGYGSTLMEPWQTGFEIIDIPLTWRQRLDVRWFRIYRELVWAAFRAWGWLQRGKLRR